MPARSPLWLIQSNMRDRGLPEQIRNTIEQLGDDACLVPVVPFSPELPPLPAGAAARPIICLGASFVPRIEQCEWSPGIFFSTDNFRWSTLSKHWRSLMFSAGELMPLGDTMELLAQTPYFVRPDHDSKAFDGAVYHDWDTLRAQMKTVDPHLPVIVAKPEAVDAESRCFVVAGSVVDSSEYRRAGKPSLRRGAPPRAIELVEQAAALWLPAPVVCIDIASSGDRFGIVEANCFAAARFYACDVATVLKEVSSYVRNACLA